MRLRRALFHVVDELGLDVDREHAPLGAHSLREAHAEVPGPGAEIGDGHPRFDLDGLDDRVRLLPGVPGGVVENADPLRDVVEGVVGRGVVTVVGGRGKGGKKQDGDEHRVPP